MPTFQSIRRGGKTLAAAGLALACLLPVGAASQPQVQPPLVQTVGRPVQAPERRPEDLSALLAPYGLAEGEREVLSARMEGDGLLLACLRRGELSRFDLSCLALPNGRPDRLERYRACREASPELETAQVVMRVNMDLDREFYVDPVVLEDPAALDVLVNKYYALPQDYVPQLERLGNTYGSGSLRAEAARAFREMADQAREDGVTLRSVSAYRSYASQKSTYNRYLRQNSQKTTDTFSARPGHSEHQTGLALDINVASTRARFEDTPAYAWLQEHCAQYGFILRYPQGKSEITGYRFEPWHYRYVGVEAARVCMSQGLTYEEYLALQPVTPVQSAPDETLI